MKRRNRAPEGEYPNLSAADVVSDGVVRFYRQRTDLPFKPDNTLCVEVRWNDPRSLPTAFRTASAKESEVARKHPFAWNPEFGYVTSRPRILGTGLLIGGLFHLEGLHLIGDLPPVLAGLEALRLAVREFNGDGLKNAAHLYRVHNASMLGVSEQQLFDRVVNAFAALVRQELNARIRLVEELPRVFEDAVCRSLAILRECKLLSEWEFLDVLSPVRLAAEMGFLAGLTRDEANAFTVERLDLPDVPRPKTFEEELERDKRDAAFADRVNRRFRDVRLNPRAKGIFKS